MDIFSKCQNYMETKIIKQMGLYPYFKAIGSSGGARVKINGREIIMTGSNNYLGLTHDPRVIEASQGAIRRYGTGCTGSRLLNGNLELHVEIEEKLAKFLNKEAALVFSTGFTANQGTLESLCKKGDIILSDEENHASIISGCSMSKAEIKKYNRHNMASLMSIIEETDSSEGGRLLISDGVFSMTGGIAPLKRILDITRNKNISIMVDDAHSLGVLGANGRGTADYFGLSDQVDIIMGTFSKSFCSIGGFIAADADVIEYVKHKSRSFIFSASIPPAAGATVLKCLEIMENEPEIIDKLWDNTKYIREGLLDLGIDNLGSKTPINPILIKDDLSSFQITAELFEMGVYVTPIVFPAVPKGQALIRTSVMATHTKEDIDQVLDALSKIVKKYKINFKHQKVATSEYQVQQQVAC